MRALRIDVAAARPDRVETRVRRKQKATHEDFVRALHNIESLVPRAVYEDTLQRTVEEVRRVTAGKRVAFAWSGGKDSIALEVVALTAGIPECVLVVCDLEFPAFLAWVREHAPSRLEVVNTGQDLDWLAKHPTLLFPSESSIAGRWFSAVQHTGQERYYRKHRLDMLLMGRRTADGNQLGPRDTGIYTARGATRYSPIRDWSHEMVFAAIHYNKLPLPPIYGWPRGFRVGTGPWPKRRVATPRIGFDEVWAIDPSRIREAAAHPGAVFDAARRYVEEHS